MNSIQKEMNKAKSSEDRLRKHVGKLTEQLTNVQLVMLFLTEVMEEAGLNLKVDKCTGMVSKKADIDEKD